PKRRRHSSTVTCGSPSKRCSRWLAPYLRTFCVALVFATLRSKLRGAAVRIPLALNDDSCYPLQASTPPSRALLRRYACDLNRCRGERHRMERPSFNPPEVLACRSGSTP